MFRIGEFELDTRNYCLKKNGTVVEVEPKVFDLLAVLTANSGRLVTRESLFKVLWSGQIVSDTSLSNQVKAARKILGDDGRNQRFIKTIHGRGYQFVARVEEINEEHSLDEPRHLQIASKKLSDGRPSIAVLPFANLNGDPEYDYFVDGITEDILIGLCRFRNLLVISRGSVFLFKNKPTDSVEIAEKLGAEFLLEGSIRLCGERVRITAQLVDGLSGNYIWTESYDRVLNDIFSVQDDVTQRIIATMATRLEAASREAALKKANHNLTVYDFLLRAKHCYPEWNGTREEILKARKLYEQALKLDPACAVAYSGIACTYIIEYKSGWCEDKALAGEHCYWYARKALSIDDRDSNAHAALASAHRDIRVDLDLALAHIEKAISANPHDYWNYCCKGNLLLMTSKLEESIDCAHEALRRSPLLPDTCIASIGVAEYFAKKYSQAITTFGESLHPKPYVDAFLSACYAQIDQMDKAIAASHVFRERNQDEPIVNEVENPEDWRIFLSRVWHFRDPKLVNHILDGLRKAEIVRL